MTRIRTVKGKITETVKEDYSFHSLGNILEASQDVVAEEGAEIFYGEYEKYKPSSIKAEKNEYKLESTYAHDQLSLLARELDEVPFMCFIAAIFGEEIEPSAMSRLYRGLKNNIIKVPEIVITKNQIKGRKANYSNYQQKIFIWDHQIDLAIKDEDFKAELFAILVEEYGHHIDNLLRTELATNPKKDTDYIDEGAKFAYALFSLNIFKEKEINFAKVKTLNYTGNLTLDFSALHNIVKENVDTSTQYDGIPGEDLEAFGAGVKKGMHGYIENEALKDIFTTSEIEKIYYGNWLRDYSQVIVPAAVRLEEEDIYKIINSERTKEQKEFLLKSNSCKPSQEDWVNILRILAAKEFIFKKKEFINKVDLFKEFDDKFGKLTKDILGVYRPEEHIDNPKGLTDDSNLNIRFEYEYQKGVTQTKSLYAGENVTSLGIDEIKMMKNYIFKDIEEKRPSSTTYMKQQLHLAIQYGKNKEGFRHFGAALHVLEDYFAHSNFIEIYLRKLGQNQFKGTKLGDKLSNVYPWVENKEKEYYAKIPIVTGNFLEADTAASILPKLADKIFPAEKPDGKPKEKRKPGERTFKELFTIAILNSLKNGQGLDGKELKSKYKGLKRNPLNPKHKKSGENNPKQKGFDLEIGKNRHIKLEPIEIKEEEVNLATKGLSTSFLDQYESYLNLLDDFIRYEEECRDYIKGIRTPDFSIFGIEIPSIEIGKKIVGTYDYLKEKQDRLSEYIEYANNIGFNFILKSTEEIVKIGQTHFSNEHYGSDPSHTQLAKDSPEHPLNALANDLAIIAVRDVGKKIKAIWDKDKEALSEDAFVNYVVDTYFVHPKDFIPPQKNTNNTIHKEFDEKIMEWIYKNEETIEKLKDKTVYEHTHNETTHYINEHSDEINKYRKKAEEIFEYFKSFYK